MPAEQSALELDVDVLIPAAVGGVITNSERSSCEGPDYYRGRQWPHLARCG